MDRRRLSHRALPIPANPKMKILSIDHVQIAMPIGEKKKPVRSISTFSALLKSPSLPELAKRGGAWFQSGNVQLHLGVEKDFRPARKAHPAFIVDNLDALIEKVSTNAIQDTDTTPTSIGSDTNARMSLTHSVEWS